MKPWQPGDPVGCGQVYLPTAKLREAYGAQCLKQIMDAAALAVINAPELATRQAMIARHPLNTRDLLKQHVKELWERRVDRR